MPSRRSILMLSALFIFSAGVFAKGPVAVVASLTGSATLRYSGQKAAPVHTLDWLSEAVRIEIEPKSTMWLILPSGRNYELRGGAVATIDSTALTVIAGPVRELKR